MLLVASCYGNRDKLRPDGPLGSCADFLLEEKEISNLLRLVCAAIYHNFNMSLSLFVTKN